MSANESEHDWFARQIPAALANGLNAEEQARFDAHAGQCPLCAAALSEAKAVEENLASTLSELHPDAGLEDRIISGLPYRFAVPSPRFRRIAAAVAAVILVGGAGYFGLGILNRARPMIAETQTAGQSVSPSPTERLKALARNATLAGQSTVSGGGKLAEIPGKSPAEDYQRQLDTSVSTGVP